MIAMIMFRYGNLCHVPRLIRTIFLCVLTVLVARTGSIRADETPTPDHAQSGAQLHVGDTIVGSLVDSNVPDRFVVFGAYGDLLTAGVFPAAGQTEAPHLEIDAPDGSIAAQSDGLTDGVPAALVSALTLPSTGAYIIYVQTADNQALGAYTLSVSADWTLRDLNAGPFRLEALAVGTLFRPADRQTWKLRLAENTQFTITAQPSGSGTLDPVIEVLSPLGDRLAVAHDFSAAHLAQTGLLLAPTTGVYQVRVSAYANQSVGPYDLVAHTVAAPTPYLTPQPIDQRLDGHVDAGSQFTYSFQGVPGQTVSIEVHSHPSGAFDPVLEVYGPSGRRVAMNDDVTPQDADSALQITLNDGAGTYSIRVSGYALMAGNFLLSVQSP